MRCPPAPAPASRASPSAASVSAETRWRSGSPRGERPGERRAGTARAPGGARPRAPRVPALPERAAADFTFDDKVIVRDNPRLASPGRVGEIFTSHYFGGPLSTAKNYRPVVLLTYAVQRWTTGTDPLPFHVVNVALHVGTTLLFAAWLLALGMPRGPSLAAAALFAVVPIHVEAVTGIVGRAELLVASLVFLAALLFRRATDGPRLRRVAVRGRPRRVPPRRSSRRRTPSSFPASSSSESSCGATRTSRSARGSGGRRFRSPASSFRSRRSPPSGSSRMGGLVAKKEAFFELDNPLAPLPHLLRAANGLWLLLRYVAKTFVPLGLSADHSAHALDLSRRSPTRARAPASPPSSGSWRWASRRSDGSPSSPSAIAFFLGTFLPTSNVFFPIGTIYGDRLAYLPSAGLLAAAAGLVAALPALSSGFRAGAPRRRARDVRGRHRRAERGLPRRRAALRRHGREGPALRARPLQRGVPGVGRAARRSSARASLEKAVALFPRYYDAWALLGLVARKEGAVGRRPGLLSPGARAQAGLRDRLAGAREGRGGVGAARRGGAGLRRRAPAPSTLRAAASPARGASPRPRPARGGPCGLARGARRGRRKRARAHSAWRGPSSALGREAEAVSEARRALAAAPGWLEARLFLAERYEARGNAVAAAAELGRAVRGAPRDPKPARLLLELGTREAMARGIASTVLPGIEKSFGSPRGTSRCAPPSRRIGGRGPPCSLATPQSAKSGGITAARARRLPKDANQGEVRQRAEEDREGEHADRPLDPDRPHRRSGLRPEGRPEEVAPRHAGHGLLPRADDEASERQGHRADGAEGQGVDDERAEEDVELVELQEDRDEERDDPVEAEERREGDGDADREGGRDLLRLVVPAEHLEELGPETLEPAVVGRQGRDRRPRLPRVRRARSPGPSGPGPWNVTRRPWRSGRSPGPAAGRSRPPAARTTFDVASSRPIRRTAKRAATFPIAPSRWGGTAKRRP